MGLGYEVILATLDWGPMVSPPLFLKTFSLGWGPRRLGRSPALKQWLSHASKFRDIDLNHNHSIWMMPSVYPGWVAKKYKIPFIVSPRGTFSEWATASGSKVKRIFWPLVQRPALEAVTCFHATAESEYEDVRRLGFHQPVAIIPNGVDVPELLPKQESNIRTLLFLGRIHRSKGLDILLPAWGVLQKRFPNWRLVIAGPDNGGYLAEIQKLASELKLEHVEFLGPLYGREKWLAYNNADLFVLPTYSENFGMTVAEALAAGTPAIASKGAPWKGLVREGAGWWIEIGVDSLIAALAEALVFPEQQLRTMGLNGRKWMVQEFSWEVIGLKMADVYRWLCSQSNRPACVRVD
jgi:glycosyltransferase involved in cell wall biosynthesis